LGESDSDGRWLVGDKVLKVSSGDVLTSESKHTIFITLLSKLNGDWRWLVSNEVLQSTSGYVLVEEGGEVITITLLGKLNGNWRWLVGHEVLQGTSGDVLVKESREVITVGLFGVGIKLKKSLGDWTRAVLDKVDKSLLCNVLSVKDTNLGVTLLNSILPVGSHVINGVITIIIWESLIERLGKSNLSIIRVLEWWSGGSLWDSLDHHGDSDVIVVSDILLFISVLLEDGVESVVSNNLSEGFKSDRFDVVKSIGWGDLEGNGLSFINWDIESLGVLIKVSLVIGLLVNEGMRLWWGGVLDLLRGISVSLHEGDTFMVLFVVVVLLSLKLSLRRETDSFSLRSKKSQCGRRSDRFHN